MLTVMRAELSRDLVDVLRAGDLQLGLHIRPELHFDYQDFVFVPAVDAAVAPTADVIGPSQVRDCTRVPRMLLFDKTDIMRGCNHCIDLLFFKVWAG